MRSPLILLLVAALFPVESRADTMRFDDLFRNPTIQDASLSPDGRYLVYFRGNMLVIGESEGPYSDVHEIGHRFNVEDILWIGSESLWIELRDSGNGRWHTIAIKFKALDDGGFGVADIEEHNIGLIVIDTMPENASRLVVTEPKWRDDKLTAGVYRINAFAPLKKQLEIHNRVRTGSSDFIYYVQNADGQFVIGVQQVDETPIVWRRLPGEKEWTKVWAADKESTFTPVGISADHRTLWVLSNAETDTVVAAEFDLTTNTFGATLYQHRRADVDQILMSEDGTTPIGIRFIEGGLAQYVFFGEDQDRNFESLRAHFPEQGIRLIGRSADSSRYLVQSSSSTVRGKIHVCDIPGDWCKFVESVAPWLDGTPFAETIALEVESTDGFVVDAFLTLPLDAGDSVPLVAVPHGGPIGVSDTRYFSPEVQWLAHKGYAVVQVNYRGSGGYGQSFREAGVREWGRGIEDDVEAAVNRVLEDYPALDQDRVGIFGGSYGGYSAMMSVIRNPELFKCAASFAGVMDLTLLFTANEVMHQRNEDLRETFIEYVGDPNVDYAEQVEHSPVYRYQDIKRPVLLMHGYADSRVDYEHTWRMQKMLNLIDAPHELVMLPNIGHWPTYINEHRRIYNPLIEFLDEHLK